MSRPGLAKKPYGIDNPEAAVPEFRQFDVHLWATRRMAHFTPLMLRRVRTKTGCRKTFRQPHGAIITERSRGSPVCLSAEGRRCNAAKLGCGYPTSVTRDPMGGAHSRAVYMRRPAAFRLPLVYSHVRAPARRSCTAVRRQGRGVRAYDAACVGLSSSAQFAANPLTKSMIDQVFLAKSVVMMQSGWNS